MAVTIAYIYLREYRAAVTVGVRYLPNPPPLMAKNVPIEGLDDDFIYFISEAALIIGKSQKTLWSYYSDGVRRREKMFNGRTQTFISASSLKEFALRHPDRVNINFDAVAKFTPAGHDETLKMFEEVRKPNYAQPIPTEKPEASPDAPADNAEVPRLYEFMEGQLAKAEKLIEAMRGENRETSERYMNKIEDIARKEAEATLRLQDFAKELRRMIQAHNRDLLRIRSGVIDSAMVPLLPLPSLQNAGELENTTDDYREEGERTNAKQPPAGKVIDAEVQNSKRAVAKKSNAKRKEPSTLIIAQKEPEQKKRGFFSFLRRRK